MDRQTEGHKGNFHERFHDPPVKGFNLYLCICKIQSFKVAQAVPVGHAEGSLPPEVDVSWGSRYFRQFPYFRTHVLFPGGWHIFNLK